MDYKEIIMSIKNNQQNNKKNNQNQNQQNNNQNQQKKDNWADLFYLSAVRYRAADMQ